MNRSAVCLAALLSGGLMLPTTSAIPTSASDGFLEALPAGAPLARPPQGASSDLYDALIGDWDAEVVDHLPDGTERRQSAEMHFAWVLEGRAIQDLWIAPARGDRAAAGTPPAEGNRYGTTLRVYDPAKDVWRITWINPVTGVETRLVGRRVGAQIVQTGADADGRLVRWVFAEVGGDSFHWRGEVSADGGRSWTCDTEFLARRRIAGAPRAPEQPRERRVSWSWTDRPGLESLRLSRDADGVTAEGRVLVVLDGVPVTAGYRIEHDVRWRFLAARIEGGPPDGARALEIRRDEPGRWFVDGAPRPDLDGCEDLDFMATPYTNTPPLAAHRLALGERRRLRVAWVRLPDLHVRAVEQEYVRLETGDADEEARRYRYHNLESGFTGELTVDADGLVLEYGPWLRSSADPRRKEGCCAVIELRQYTLKPGQREALIALFERELLEPQEAAGMTVVGQFRDRERADRFVWVRGFPDMARRLTALERFYDGPVWAAHRDAANATMIDSDDVLLLRPARPDLAFQLPPRGGARIGRPAAVVAAIYSLTQPAGPALVSRFEKQVRPALAARGVRVLGVFVTESDRNSFRLPVRTGENVLAWFGVRDSPVGAAPGMQEPPAEAYALDGTTPVLLHLEPTTHSRLRTGRDGEKRERPQ